MNLLRDLSLDLRPWKRDHFLLGVSGGMDSMALFHTFLRLRDDYGYQFSVAHCHHGDIEEKAQRDFRDQAQGFVVSVCEQFQVDCFVQKSDKGLCTEEECRKYRHNFFRDSLKTSHSQHIVLAHHWEDLLETRLIRLIRGTGAQGLMAMQMVSPPILRPFLCHHRRELKAALKLWGASWVEDPSNVETVNLRSWLRQEWLPSLEAHLPGGSQALGRSLDRLAHELELREPAWKQCLVQGEILISELLVLDREQKTQVLAHYMKSQGLKNYGLSHIYEILKRLDTEKKTLTFNLLGRCWKVDAGRMSVAPPA